MYRSTIHQTPLWFEEEHRIFKVRHIIPEAGKTGKGIIVFWERADQFGGKDFPSWCGQNSAIDIEDIVWIT